MDLTSVRHYMLRDLPADLKTNPFALRFPTLAYFYRVYLGQNYLTLYGSFQGTIKEFAQVNRPETTALLFNEVSDILGSKSDIKHIEEPKSQEVLSKFSKYRKVDITSINEIYDTLRGSTQRSN
jgi:hypothetical protein